MMPLIFRSRESRLLQMNPSVEPDLPAGFDPDLDLDSDEAFYSAYPRLRIVGLASLVLAVTAVGLFLGRELRQRYKFNHRTPYDFYSKAGDPVAITEYGMGV